MSMLPNTTIFKRLSSQEDLNNDEITFEEKHKDAIYNVTYRKIYNQQQQQQQQQQQSQQNNNNNCLTNGLVYSKIKIKQIKYGTIEKLIDCFTNENGELDSNTTNTFLATYRTFTNIKNVLEIIYKKYSKIFPASLDMTEEIRITHLKSFRSIITTWLDSYSEDFNEPPAFVHIRYLEKFCNKYIPESTELINFLKDKLDNYKSLVNKTINHQRSTSTSSLHNSKSELNLLNNNGNSTQTTTTTTTTVPKIQHYRSNSNSISNIDQIVNNKNFQSDLLTSFDLKNTNFFDIDELYFAEQLTYIDKELFQKVIPHHCLGAIWSSRKKQNNGNNNFETISAFIDQFNIITFIVQGTVLENYNQTPYQRAKIIEKWIRIALYCRNYKNFSSLNAIVQGLDTQCVSRLEKTWSEVTFECKTQFKELIELFSQENNQQQFRETLMRDLQEYDKRLNNSNYNNNNDFSSSNNLLNSLDLLEGTAKFADINIGINATLSRKAKERLMKKHKLNEPLGTVPFLGTFLRDLEYIHAQNPTKTDDGLINFAKKRKEFEIIAQIKLLQRAAQFYRITPDPYFKTWLKSLPSFSEEIIYELSYQIEPKEQVDNLLHSISNSSTNSTNSNTNNKKKSSLSRSSRCESLESINSNDLVLKQNNQQNQHQQHNYHHQNSIISNNRHSRTSSNTSNSDVFTNNSLCSSQNEMKSSLVVRVNVETLETSNTYDPSTVCYKTILVKDSDRTKEVKRMILDKFLLEPEKADKYNLIQVFNDGINSNILIKDNCNVFYAVKNVHDIKFILRPKELNVNNNNNDINNNNNNNNMNNNHNINSNNFINNNNTNSNLFQTMVSPKINDKKNDNRSSSTSRKKYSALPPPAPSSPYHDNNNNNEKQRANWQIFRNIMS